MVLGPEEIHIWTPEQLAKAAEFARSLPPLPPEQFAIRSTATQEEDDEREG